LPDERVEVPGGLRPAPVLIEGGVELGLLREKLFQTDRSTAAPATASTAASYRRDAPENMQWQGIAESASYVVGAQRLRGMNANLSSMTGANEGFSKCNRA